MSFINKLPKAELHVHLEGTLESEHRIQLARRNAIDLKCQNSVNQDFNDLPSFLKIYYEALEVLQVEEDFYELAWHYFQRAAENNIVYTEPFFDPQAHTARGITFSTIINGIHQAQVDARIKLGIHSGLIMCFMRDLSAESALSHLEMATPYKDWIIGIGLDSDEKDNPPIKFRDVFKKARDMGFKLTMHCDVNQENSISHIKQCMEIIQVDRIDHGINSLEDEMVCNAIIEKGIGLTICPVSNLFVVQSSTVPEIRKMLQKGMLATINTDDPAYFRAGLNDNFKLLLDEGMSQEEILQLIKNSFEIAWLDEGQKNKYRHRLMQAVSELT